MKRCSYSPLILGVINLAKQRGWAFSGKRWGYWNVRHGTLCLFLQMRKDWMRGNEWKT